MQTLANTVKAQHIPMLRTALLGMLAEIDRRLAAPAALTA